MKYSDVFRMGFRRRCGWCGVTLRGWQLNLCRSCRTAVNVQKYGLAGVGPPCDMGSRWMSAPDAARWHPRHVHDWSVDIGSGYVCEDCGAVQRGD